MDGRDAMCHIHMEDHTNDQKHPKTSEGNHVIDSEKIYPLSLPDKVISCSVMKK